MQKPEETQREPQRLNLFHAKAEENKPHQGRADNMPTNS